MMSIFQNEEIFDFKVESRLEQQMEEFARSLSEIRSNDVLW